MDSIRIQRHGCAGNGVSFLGGHFMMESFEDFLALFWRDSAFTKDLFQHRLVLFCPLWIFHGERVDLRIRPRKQMERHLMHHGEIMDIHTMMLTKE